MSDKREGYAALHMRGPQPRRLPKAEIHALRRDEPRSMRPKAAAQARQDLRFRARSHRNGSPGHAETGKAMPLRAANAYMALSISISSLESSLSRSSMISSLS